MEIKVTIENANLKIVEDFRKVLSEYFKTDFDVNFKSSDEQLEIIYNDK